jgi:hypothetical protein
MVLFPPPHNLGIPLSLGPSLRPLLAWGVGAGGVPQFLSLVLWVTPLTIPGFLKRDEGLGHWSYSTGWSWLGVKHSAGSETGKTVGRVGGHEQNTQWSGQVLSHVEPIQVVNYRTVDNNIKCVKYSGTQEGPGNWKPILLVPTGVTSCI